MTYANGNSPASSLQPSTLTTDDALRHEKDRAVRGVESDQLVRTIAARIAASETRRSDAATTDPAYQLLGEVHATLDSIDPTRRFPPRSAVIAGRMLANGGRQRERRRTKIFLQPLGLAVFVEGKRCLYAVREHWILSHPRDHEVLTHWFETIEDARSKFPTAKLLTLPDVPPALRGRA
jgi:hypothetical protein